MIEYVVFLIFVGFAWTGGYYWGFWDGEKKEFKKWYGRQWHRPGCSCDGDSRE